MVEVRRSTCKHNFILLVLLWTPNLFYWCLFPMPFWYLLGDQQQLLKLLRFQGNFYLQSPMRTNFIRVSMLQWLLCSFIFDQRKKQPRVWNFCGAARCRGWSWWFHQSLRIDFGREFTCLLFQQDQAKISFLNASIGSLTWCCWQILGKNRHFWKNEICFGIFAAAAVYFRTFSFHYDKINVSYVFNVVLTLLWPVSSNFFGDLRAIWDNNDFSQHKILMRALR